MEGQEQQTATEPEKIYDVDKGEFVDNPDFKREEDQGSEEESGDESETESSSEEQESTTKKEGEGESESESEEEEEEGSESGESEEEEEGDGESGEEESEGEEKNKDKDEKEEVLDPDDYFKSVYGEKYGINSQSELEELIDGSLELQAEHDALKKENETLRAEAGKLTSMTPKQKKAVEFISQFDIDRQGEGLDTFAKLIAMDVDKSDDMLVLEERYIHEHPEWTRAEAQRMFLKEHNRRYNLKKEDFDSEEEYKNELEDLAIMKKGEVQRARTFLKEKQATYKPEPAKDKTPEVSEAVTKSIEKNTAEYTEFADKTNEIVFEQGKDKYTFKLDADKKKVLMEAVKAWVKNPANYNNDGKIKGIKSPSEMLNNVIGAMYMKDIINAIADQVKNSVNIKRVDEVAKHQPKKRKSPGSGDTRQSNDLYSQAQQLIKKRRTAAN